MHKKKSWRDIYNISDEEFCELCKQPTAQMVLDAVSQYNHMVSLSSHVEGKNEHDLLRQKAEEEDAKAFLDGVFDIIQTQT
jgi:hypothetical protein